MKLVKMTMMAASLLLTIAVNAQTADEIVARHVAALGGKENFDKVKSVYIESTMQVMGNEAPAKIYILNGKGYRSELDFNGQAIVQAFNDKNGWMINPMTGSTSATAVPEEQYANGRDQIYIGGPLLYYPGNGKKIELEGKEGDLYKLKVSSGNNSVYYFIDPSTYLTKKTVSKANMQGQEVEMTVNYSNYKKTDAGYMMPYDIEIDFGGFSMASSVKKVEVNKAIDPAIFDMPK